MSKFKCGDRVRIVYMGKRFGKEATILAKEKWTAWDHVGAPEGRAGPVGQYCYTVDIDGVGRVDPVDRFHFAYNEHELIPLVSPDELAWQKFREHLKPNPLVIFDADPIIVSTDEEAARIAETVPNSHIIVAVYRNGKRIVLSEYYGQSTTNQPEGQ